MTSIHVIASRCRALVLVLALAAISAARPCEGQHPADEKRREQLLTVARRIMTTAKYAACITLDASGRPQARTVDPFLPDSLMHVWFATNPRTRKVGEIRRDARVTLHYFDPGSQGYVTVIGRAVLVNDRAEKAKRFKPEWSAFYPDREKGYLLVHVVPERLEVVSVKDKVEGDAITWRPPAVQFQRGK